MRQAAAHPTTNTASAKGFGVGMVALAFLDVTWRIAVPVVGLTLLGIYADLHLGTKPWLTLVAVVAGFAVAVLLVKRQIAAVEKAENESETKQGAKHD